MNLISYSYITYFIVIFIKFTPTADCKRILALMPHVGKSHFEAFKPYLEGLADRGHDVTVVSFFPQTKPPYKYRDISLVGLMPIYLNSVTFDLLNYPIPEFIKPYISYGLLAQWGLDHCKNILPSSQIQAIIKQKGEYDFAIVEQFSTDCFLGVVHKLQIPFVALSSCAVMPWSSYRSGFYENPAFTPISFGRLSDQQTFLERLENTVLSSVIAITYPLLFTIPTNNAIQTYIGDDMPPINEILNETGLVLINSHFAITGPRLYPPNMIEVGGMHLKAPKPLPPALQKFADNWKNGMVIFSLGSMVDSNTLPDEIINAFLNAFKKFDHIGFVWKFGRNLTNVPNNVMMQSWLPQRDLLVHENVRAFMTHGGLLGMTEGLFSGKPLVAFPLFGDQFHNVAFAVRQKIGVKLSIQGITQEKIENALATVLSEEYQIQAKLLGKRLNSNLKSPLDTAIFWTEHVMEHGSEHLRLHSTNLNWAQYFLVDVGLVILFILFTIALIVRSIIKYLRKSNVSSNKKNK